ncbi:MAG: T9SS type A sorting domain-containing protein [Candidatus Cloacimonetes bacterium]|nr:T9SS type A sorting domain-containing protein [Candidatus Cloacimonadota bacterium]
MKKIFLPVLILVLFASIVSADVQFQYEFTIDKFNSNDILQKVYLFDYNNDGIDDYAIDYSCYEAYGLFYKYVSGLYNSEGALFDELHPDWYERYYFFQNYNLENRSIFIHSLDDSLFIQLKEYNTGSILDSIKITITEGHFFTYITDVNSKVLNDTTYLFVGAMKKWNYIGDEYFTSYFFILKIVEDEIFHQEGIENSGFNSINANNKNLSIGFFYDNLDNAAYGSETFNYYLKCTSFQDSNSVESLHYAGGLLYYTTPNEWNHCPQNYEILTKNPLGDYPHVLYYQQYDSEDGDSVFFYAYDLDIPEKVWSREDTLLNDSKITASTCVMVNDEVHYVMYFYDNHTLEIRDRLNGNIVHQQDSVFIVSDILRKSNGDLLFFVEKNDETGYDVYSFDGPIFVSNDESPTQNEFVIEQFPNPFRNHITFSFKSKELIQNAEIKIYNIKGQLIQELHPFSSSPLHHFESTWDGNDKHGQKVTPGLYLYQVLINGEQKAERKCLLIE